MKITFLGTHGQYNLGDELLLETFLAQLGPQHHYAVNSYDPEFTAQMLKPKFDVETFHTTGELPSLLKHLLSSDLLFFGGGSIIKELYASVGRNRYSTLWMILAIVTFTRQIARKRIIMSNIGVGPLLSPGGERLARMILRQVDFVSVRDDKSLLTCQKLGLKPEKLRRVPDAVFANTAQVFLRDAATITLTRNLRIALNLNYDIENRAAWESFLTNLADCLIQLNQQTPIEIHALPMQSRFKANDDLSVLKEFAQRLPGIPFIMNEPQTSQQVADIITRSDLVLAERLHTMVIASILGKPFYGLIYDVKVAELINYLGMEKYALNINQPFETKTLLAGIQNVHTARKTIGQHLKTRSSELRAELVTYFEEIQTKIKQY
ncbi:MAG: polysaccharide pyruvyl transferase family protein [Chloroflexi bacterium]|nr:polysaccharide pyruvyl transferase family protein [Chloroflexota bacterium]